MSSMPRVSVVAPVYNVGLYLRKFVDSILGQTYRDIEFICVDDGSTDESVSILESYGDRIKIIRIRNQGAGVARNVGLEAATGEYVYFCDPDDWCEPQLIELCEKRAEEECCDMVVFGRRIHDEAQENAVQCKLLPARVTALGRAFSPEQISESIFNSFGLAPWNKFYRRDYLREKGIRFQDLPRNNDIYFTCATCAQASRIGVVNVALYNYRKNRPGGLQDGNDSTPLTLFAVFFELEKTLTEKGVLGKFKSAFDRVKVSSHLAKLRLLRSCGTATEYVRVLRRDPLFDTAGEFYRTRRLRVPEHSLSLYECVCNTREEPIVSLTSFPARIEIVNQAIESVLRQTYKPARILLWLAGSQFPNGESDLPPQLLALRKYGLEIHWCENYRSHKKLLPALREYADSVIITVDDDVIYSDQMIEKLYRTHIDFPEDVICHKVTKFVVNPDGSFGKMGGGRHWFKGASALNKLVGVAGTLYPSNCFKTGITDAELALKLAPTNDDQWFWVHAVLSGRKVRRVENGESYPHSIEGSQTVSLCSVNDHGAQLFFRDFSNLCAYYPEFVKALKDEWSVRANEPDVTMQIGRETGRIKMFITWPMRRASRMLKCYRENGWKYTLRRLIRGKGRGRR